MPAVGWPLDPPGGLATPSLASNAPPPIAQGLASIADPSSAIPGNDGPMSAAGLSPADTYDKDANGIAGYIAAQRQKSVDEGLLDPDTGMPTPAGMSDMGNQYMMGMIGSTSAPGPIRAFHGSPHMFDKFDLSSIGTGEGAQAFGHGLYFAGDEAVAQSYRDTLSRRVSNYEALSALNMDNAWVNAAGTMTRTHTPEEISSILKQAYPKITNDQVAMAIHISNPNPGSMYEVNLHTDPSNMLDWDKPLSAQNPLVQQQAQALSNRGIAPRNLDPELTGGELYQELMHKLETTQRAAGALAAPIPGTGDGLHGIKYLDGQSRAAGQGSSNYVMFNPKQIEILRRYGLLGTAAAGAAAGAVTSQSDQPPVGLPSVAQSK